MIATIQQRNFALIWLGGLISLVGDQVVITAIPFYLYRLTGSVLQVGALTMVYFVPAVVLSSLAGVLVDRWDLKSTIVAINMAQAVGLLPLLAVRSAAMVWVVYAVVLCQSVLGLFIGPAIGAVLPRLVGSERLSTANALSSMGANAARLVGPPLGGLLLAGTGLMVVTMVDTISFLIAGILAAFLTMERRGEAAGGTSMPKALARAGTMWSAWRDGLAIIWERRILVAIMVIAGIGTVADAMLGPLMVPFVRDILGGSAVTYGWISTVTGVGGILGASLIGRVGQRVNPLHLVVAGLLGVGTIAFVRYNVAQLPVALATFFAGGIGAATWSIARVTVLQTETPEGYRGRVFGAFGMNTSLMLLVGTAVATVFGGVAGVVVLLNVSAALYVVAGLVAVGVVVSARPTRFRDDVTAGGDARVQA